MGKICWYVHFVSQMSYSASRLGTDRQADKLTTVVLLHMHAERELCPQVLLKPL